MGRPPEGVEDEEQIKEMHKDHAWFVAYAPSVDPQIAIAVIVEHGEHGSSAAAPIASEMIRAYLGGDEDTVELGKPPGVKSFPARDGRTADMEDTEGQETE